MLASVRALLEHLIDYAGLFPPARLPLPQALRHYTRPRATPEAWMLARFVCPASRLAELRAAALADDAPPLLMVIASLARGGRDIDQIAAGLDADLSNITQFRDAGGAAVAVDVIELPLPAGLTTADVDRLAGELLPPLTSAGLRVFCELPLTASWVDDLAAVSAALARRAGGKPAWVGLKVRCGGAIVPSVEQLAHFIETCHQRGLPWKATAGLHHPLCHHDPATQTIAHGFLNVFIAGILARVHGLRGDELGAVLREESAASFQFGDTGFAWRAWRCTNEQVRDARRDLPSFGSCSFDEPRDDLRSLGML